MFYTATKDQVEQLFPDLLTIEPGKMRLYYTQPDGTKRMVDRCHGYFFSDKPWGLDQEYLTEGIDQEFVDDQDYLSLNIRNSIKAPDGWTFVSCDYAAEELRLGAINTKGKVFLDAFRHNKDPHLNTALMMFGEEAVHQNKKKYRSLAKGCNSVDALYATEDGYKKLSETDHILDLNGNKQKFINVVEERDMYRLYLSNGKIIDVTTNHKYKDFGMLYPEYKEVYEGMQLGMNRIENNHFSTNDTYTYKFTKQIKGELVETSYNIKLTRRLGYLIGLYLGDGTLPIPSETGTPGGMNICCHPSNADYVQSIMQEYKGELSRKVRREDNNNFVLLWFFNDPLLRFVSEHFGRTKTKRVSELCYQFPLEFNLGIIDGLIDSDGSVGTDNAHFGVNSELLARSVANLIAFVGLPAKWKETTYTYKGITKPFYYVTLEDMRYTDLHVDYKRERLNGKLNRYLSYKLYDVKDSKFNGKYYDKLNLMSKGMLKVLTCRAIEKYIPTMEHNNYWPVTIDRIEKIRGLANIMECDTHYYVAETFNQPNCNFALQYGGSWRAIQQEGMSDADTQAIYDAYMTAQSDHFAVQNSQVRKTHETLTEYSFFGLPVRLHNYYKSDNYSMVSAGERLAKNHRIQGCLKYETKILTDLGYIPIGELYDHYQEKYYTTKVWTGHRWAEFVPVYKGKHIFHKLHFDNGQILECDGRHKIKVFTDDGYIWKEVPYLKPGDVVAQSIPPEERANYDINSEVYYKLKLTKVENMHEEIDTYTLAVNDELHQFDSEGIISKNTGADVLSISYIKLWNNIFNKIPGIEDLVRFQITVHDEIDFIVRNDVIDIIVPEIIRCMQTQMPDWEIPLTIGLSFGPTFGQQYEFLYDHKTFKVIGPDMSPVEKKENKKEQPKTETKPTEETTQQDLTLDF